MSNSLSFADRLATAVTTKKSVVCVGLDPRFAQLPDCLRDSVNDGHAGVAKAYRDFCRGIIDVVAEMVPVVKPQAAFFEAIGPEGTVALADVISYANQRGLIVILDGKRGDIGSTATAYAEGYLGAGDRSPWGSDALTVNPYLGEDAIEPFVDQCDRRDAGIFVLVKTSNPGGGLLQDRVSEGATVYQATADLVTKLNTSRLGDCGFGPVGSVVGATYPEQLAELREQMPTSWILIPGFGAQGGGADDVRSGFNRDGLGAVVNSSRHIIFAHARPEFSGKYGHHEWQRAVEAATEEMNAQLAFIH